MLSSCMSYSRSGMFGGTLASGLVRNAGMCVCSIYVCMYVCTYIHTYIHTDHAVYASFPKYRTHDFCYMQGRIHEENMFCVRAILVVWPLLAYVAVNAQDFVWYDLGCLIVLSAGRLAYWLDDDTLKRIAASRCITVLVVLCPSTSVS